MSRTRDLQNFLRDNRKIRPSGESPHDTQEEDKRLSDKEMREANVKAIEEARRKGKSPLTPNQTKIVQDIKEDIEESKEMPLLEKDGGGGGGGAGGAGGLAGGGTVAVASDPGVFTPTYGGDSKRRLGMAPTKRKKKKKKEKDKAITTGVTKADRFLRGEEVNQARKSVQQFAQWLVEEARTGLIQLDAKKENVNTGEVNESPRVASKPTSLGSQKVKNPQGRRGNFGPAPGQQGVSRPQFEHFTKMRTISKVLNSNPSVLSLLKALDIDVPIGVD